MRDEENLLEQKELRESVIDRIEVLDNVGEILLLPNTEFATTEMVAKYYKVDIEVIKKVSQRFNNELLSDGYKIIQGGELREIKSLSCFKSRARSLAIFSKRSILRVGMLLRDSEVAKEIRNRLLDIVHDSEKGQGNISNVINEIDEEKQLQMELGIAICEGNMQRVIEIQTEINQKKNKRIQKLEKEKEIIVNNALTIKESRSIINRIVRQIGFKVYNNVGVAWNELYSKINYKLHINIKARDKKKNQSWLDTLSEEEILEVEKIVRSWAIDNDIDLIKSLKIT